jgi:hypothetical protein
MSTSDHITPTVNYRRYDVIPRFGPPGALLQQHKTSVAGPSNAKTTGSPTPQNAFVFLITVPPKPKMWLSSSADKSKPTRRSFRKSRTDYSSNTINRRTPLWLSMSLSTKPPALISAFLFSGKLLYFLSTADMRTEPKASCMSQSPK